MSLTSVDPQDLRAVQAVQAGRVALVRWQRETAALRAMSWPLARLGEALDSLARHSGLATPTVEVACMPDETIQAGAAEWDRWAGWAAARMGLEAEASATNVPGLGEMLRSAAPAILRFHDHEGPRLMLLTGVRRRTVTLIGPDHQRHTCALEDLRRLLAAPAELRVTRDIDRVLELTQLGQVAAAKTRAFMLADRLRNVVVEGILILRTPATATFSAQLGQASTWFRISGIALLSGLLYGLEILGWAIIGEAALNGRMDFGWLAGWVLLVMTLIPVRLLSAWLMSITTIDVGRLIKARLFEGSLRSNMDEIRRTGSGRLLARVMEAQSFEALAIGGSLGALVSVIELLFSVWLLSMGTGGAILVAMLGLCTVVSVIYGALFHKRLAAWTAQRGGMTHALIERMAGHRTVLAQERVSSRLEADDASVKTYLDTTRHLDGAAVPLVIVVKTVWSALGLLGLAPAFIAGTSTPAGLAIALGGILFAARALGGVTAGIMAAAQARVAWREIQPLFRAAEPADHQAAPFLPRGSQARSGVLVDAEGLAFAHAGGQSSILHDTSLRIAHGERLLLQGHSGSGKSTLASVLTGLRQPQSGLLLLEGLDHRTLGDSWHDLATKAPQFHENHIFSGTLAFNLLMARAWPASEDDLAEARQVCIELGLGDLIDRMPSGLQQTVGETGWQLSHGERSRIFLARALLQNAPLTILDESFAALDPETIEKCLACAFRRAPTLVVIAHL